MKEASHWRSHIIWFHLCKMSAKSLQSCPTLCDPIDGSPPGSPVPGVLQARTLAWVAISFSNAGKWKVKVKSLSRVRLLATPWTAAYQAPLSMGFSRQEYWSGLPLPSPCKMSRPGKSIKTENRLVVAIVKEEALLMSMGFSFCRINYVSNCSRKIFIGDLKSSSNSGVQH